MLPQIHMSLVLVVTFLVSLPVNSFGSVNRIKRFAYPAERQLGLQSAAFGTPYSSGPVGINSNNAFAPPTMTHSYFPGANPLQPVLQRDTFPQQQQIAIQGRSFPFPQTPVQQKPYQNGFLNGGNGNAPQVSQQQGFQGQPTFNNQFSGVAAQTSYPTNLNPQRNPNPTQVQQNYQQVPVQSQPVQNYQVPNQPAQRYPQSFIQLLPNYQQGPSPIQQNQNSQGNVFSPISRPLSYGVVSLAKSSSSPNRVASELLALNSDNEQKIEEIVIAKLLAQLSQRLQQPATESSPASMSTTTAVPDQTVIIPQRSEETGTVGSGSTGTIKLTLGELFQSINPADTDNVVEYTDKTTKTPQVLELTSPLSIVAPAVEPVTFPVTTSAPMGQFSSTSTFSTVPTSSKRLPNFYFDLKNALGAPRNETSAKLTRF